MTFSKSLFLKVAKKSSTSLLQGLHGIEKESLRVDANSTLALTSHPAFFGSALFNPYISLDFAEAQLELITSAQPSIEKAFNELESIHGFIQRQLKNEWMWPFSVPCALPGDSKIALASFGLTQEGYKKWLYRKGLSYRYGKAMQLLSGIHYSFSFSFDFFKELYDISSCSSSLEEFISEKYLHMTRNFLRMGWICSYLFGASPVVHRSYFEKIPPYFKKNEAGDLFVPEATSIRMSQWGYFSKIQRQHAVSFNSLSAYKNDLKKLIKMPHPEFEKLGLYQDEKQIQMNFNLLQIEAEHYSRIRPKPLPQKNKSSLEALDSGIGYLETRILDLDPFSPSGISQDSLYFTHLLLLYTLFCKSPFFTCEGKKELCLNQNQVALFGRKKGLTLQRKGQSILMKDWAEEILDDLFFIASHMGPQKEVYEKVLKRQLQKVQNSHLTPSYQVLKKVTEEKGLVFLGIKQAKLFKKQQENLKVKKEEEKKWVQASKESMKKLQAAEENEEDFLAGYEDLEFSTQMLLKEAIRRGIQFDFIDRKENFLTLSKDGHSVDVKQATLTPLDSLTTFALMHHKEITKKVLRKKGLKVPDGLMYSSKKEALQDYDKYSAFEVIVKPNSTNMGVGITKVAKGDTKGFKEALQKAFKQDQSLLVEEFVRGEEYRFLVIQGKTKAVCKRVPAHVVGDGIHTVEELMQQKNERNRHRRRFQKPLQRNAEIEKELKKQNKTFKSILKKEEILYLLPNSNVSTGGESIDMSDLMPVYFKKQAEKAALSVQATFCGVDMLIEHLDEKNYRIIELNYNPALYLHRAPSSGKKRYVEKDVLDALGF